MKKAMLASLLTLSVSACDLHSSACGPIFTAVVMIADTEKSAALRGTGILMFCSQLRAGEEAQARK